jgi:hypothetical protein
MGISTCIGGSNMYPTKMQGTNLHKLPKLVRIGPKRGGTLRVMGVSTGFGMPVPVLVAHTGIGIWIFSPVTVSHFCGVNTIEMVAVIIPIKHSEFKDVMPVKGRYHVNVTAIWELIPKELNGNVLKFLSTRELVVLQSVCKNAKSTIESEKGCSLMQQESNLTRSLRNVGLRMSRMHSSSRSRITYIWGELEVRSVMLSIPPKDACKLSMMKTCLRRELTLSLVGIWEL